MLLAIHRYCEGEAVYTIMRDVSFKTMADGLRAAPIMAQIAKFYKETSGIELQMLRPASGSPTRLRIVCTIESLDSWQDKQARIAQDPAFQKLLNELSQFVDGSKTNDEIWR
jgi:hypothetical protein